MANLETPADSRAWPAAFSRSATPQLKLCSDGVLQPQAASGSGSVRAGAAVNSIASSSSEP